jgi:hypothetical protein
MLNSAYSINMEYNVDVVIVRVIVTQVTITKTIGLRLSVGTKEVLSCSLATALYRLTRPMSSAQLCLVRTRTKSF